METLHTPGGTGALRVAADLIARLRPGATVWVSTPTWPNHPQVFAAAGLTTKSYPYLDPEPRASWTRRACSPRCAGAAAGDVVLLHACCHNPTGIDPTADDWKQIGDVIAERGLLPLVDFAYQGFGDGLSEDGAGLRELVRPGAELLVASSFSQELLAVRRAGRRAVHGGRHDGGRRDAAHPRQGDGPRELLQPAGPRRRGGRHDPRGRRAAGPLGWTR